MSTSLRSPRPALANYLLTQPHGGETIRTVSSTTFTKSLDEGRVGHAAELFMALRHYLEQKDALD
jgi:hypothetical protein